MDCLKAQEILSDALDRDVDGALLAEAREHCETCPDCARLLRSLALLSRSVAPTAPPELVERLIALGNEEAASIRTIAATTEAAPESAAAESPVVHFAPTRWTPRLTAFASVAAVLLVALVATGISLGGLLSANRTATDTANTLMESGAPTAPPYLSGTDEAGTAASKDAAAIAAPPYVVLDGIVYALTGERDIDSSGLVTATPVISALDTGTDPVSIAAFRIAGENGSIALQPAPGTYLGFSVVSRTFGGRRFILTSDSVPAYGAWPGLPSRFAVPTSPDGSPTFSFFGKDDAGVLIYVPAGVAPTSGFAVAPGTTSDDPAAGNPNWTWWQAE